MGPLLTARPPGLCAGIIWRVSACRDMGVRAQSLTCLLDARQSGQSAPKRGKNGQNSRIARAIW